MAEVGRPTEKKQKLFRKMEEAEPWDGPMKEIAFSHIITEQTHIRWIKEIKK